MTQTNLLQVFDPVEMYGVLKVLQQSIKQLEAENAELLRRCSNSADRQLHSSIANWQKQAE